MEWKAKIQAADLWDAFENDKMTVEQVAVALAKRLRMVPGFEADEILHDIADDFDTVTELGEFDGYLNDLYAYLDHARIWLETWEVKA